MTSNVGGKAKRRSLAKYFKVRRRRNIPVSQCTHINMDRCYGWNQVCDNCGRLPYLGFLYICAQDAAISRSADLQASNESPKDSNGEDTAALARRELEQIGLSESVIQTAERGLYTDAQLKKLKLQKLLLNAEVQKHKDLNGRVVAKLAAESLARGPCNNDGTSASVPETSVCLRCPLLHHVSRGFSAC